MKSKQPDQPAGKIFLLIGREYACQGFMRDNRIEPNRCKRVMGERDLRGRSAAAVEAIVLLYGWYEVRGIDEAVRSAAARTGIPVVQPATGGGYEPHPSFQHRPRRR